MAIQIIPNLQAQKGAIEHQNRMQLMGQALQGYGAYQEKELADRRQKEAFRKLGYPEEAAYLPKEFHTKMAESKFPKAMTDVDIARKGMYESQGALAEARKTDIEQPKPKPLNKLQEKQIDKINAEIEEIKSGKVLTDKDRADIDLKRAQIRQIEGEEAVFGEMAGIPPKEREPSKLGKGIFKEDEGKPSEKTPTKLPNKDMTDDELMKWSALKGQKGVKGIYGQQAENILKERREKGKIAREDRKFFHEQTKDYDKELTDEAKSAREKNRALEKQIPLIKKIGAWDRFISNWLGQTKYENWFKSATAQEFDSYSLPQLKGWKTVLGGVLSDSDIRLIMQKVVTSNKEPGANEKIAEFFQLENDIAIDREKIGNEIKAKNDFYRPANYQQQVDDEIERKYGDKIRSGMEEIRAIPEDMDEWKKIGRIKVPSGTPISDEMASKYFKAAKGDATLAEKWAREDGYDFPND